MTINKLKAGFRYFQETSFKKQSELYRSLVKNGQNPHSIVIACSDSRLSPAIMFNTAPGEIFVVRNIANIVPPYAADAGFHGTNAAIEFAVCELSVSNIIVLGHSHCGGVHRICEESRQRTSREFIDTWLSSANYVVKSDLQGGELYKYVEREMIINSTNNLLTFPWVKTRVESGDIELYSWWFDITSGELFSYKIDTGWSTI